MGKLYGSILWPEDDEYYYSIWSLIAFFGLLLINHCISPFIFETYWPPYQRLPVNKKHEWNCRVGSTIHASLVTVLCLVSLLTSIRQWINPITTVSRPGSIALAISIGYMFADSITMFTFQKGLELILFCIHHILVASCFIFLLFYRIAPAYGIMRLVSEVSTPFLNQRWFYRTIGGEGADEKAAKVTLWFSFLFCLGRYVLPIPYWIIFIHNFNSYPHLQIKPDLPACTTFFIFLPSLLDLINIAWGIPVYAVTRKAIITLGYGSRVTLNQESVENNTEVHPSHKD